MSMTWLSKETTPEEEIIRDITRNIQNLRQINMKCEPKRNAPLECRKDLYLVTKVSIPTGVRASPEKADTVLTAIAPICIKEWAEAKRKISKHKQFLSSQTLTAPMEHEELIINLLGPVAKNLLERSLMTKREGRQIPVLVEELKEKSINEKEILDVVEEEGTTWMDTHSAQNCQTKSFEEKRRPERPSAPNVGPLQANYIPKEKYTEGRQQATSGPRSVAGPTLWTAEIDPATNNGALKINLDLIEERREQAAIQEAKSKKKMEKYYNTRVRDTSFKPGDMVYRSNEASHARDGGNLGPKWEGPYEVKESLGKRAYKLKDCKGNEIPRKEHFCKL
ncbi:hypothetical protein Tco_0190710 [Tanacetum coccineum]